MKRLIPNCFCKKKIIKNKKKNKKKTTPKQEKKGREEKHPLNQKTGGNPNIPTKPAHITQRLIHHIRGPLALPWLEPKPLAS
jgi:hypothetical protein